MKLRGCVRNILTEGELRRKRKAVFLPFALCQRSFPVDVSRYFMLRQSRTTEDVARGISHLFGGQPFCICRGMSCIERSGKLYGLLLVFNAEVDASFLCRHLAFPASRHLSPLAVVRRVMVVAHIVGGGVDSKT